MRRVIKHWLTEADNETFDVTKALATLSILAALGLSIYSTVVKDTPFSLQDFGVGMGALFGGLGVALGLKKEAATAESQG